MRHSRRFFGVVPAALLVAAVASPLVGQGAARQSPPMVESQTGLVVSVNGIASDVGAAIQEAALIARELLDDDPRVNEADFRTEVADEHGNDVHVIRPQDVSNQLPIRRRLREPENECGSCDVQLL